MSSRANGTFEVKLSPLGFEVDPVDEMLGRRKIEKQFLGGLEARSDGQMLSAGTTVKGSAGYVAIEKVTGTLDGRSGSFVLQHSGTMNRGVPQLSVTVVPDSGTGALTGLSGSMSIKITDGKHFYEFVYVINTPS